MKNVKIYREAMSGTRAPLKDWGFVVLVVVIMVLMLVLPLVGLIFLVQWLDHFFRAATAFVISA